MRHILSLTQSRKDNQFKEMERGVYASSQKHRHYYSGHLYLIKSSNMIQLFASASNVDVASKLKNKFINVCTVRKNYVLFEKLTKDMNVGKLLVLSQSTTGKGLQIDYQIHFTQWRLQRLYLGGPT